MAIVGLPMVKNNCGANYASGMWLSFKHQLDKRFDLRLIPISQSSVLAISIINKFIKLFSKTNGIPPVHNHLLAQSVARQIRKSPYLQECDFLFSSSTVFISLLDLNLPIFVFGDFTFANANNYYPNYGGFIPYFERNALSVERTAILNSKRFYIASEWAARESSSKLDVPKQKFKVVGMGANFESGWGFSEATSKISTKQHGDLFRFLFLGKDWHRKGGDRCVRLLRQLRKTNSNIQLDIVGCSPKIDPEDLNWINVYSMLNVNKRDEKVKLRHLFENSTAMIILSDAEAMGIAYAEGASFGLPSIAVDTGGVSMAVKDGVSGILLGKEANESDLTKLVKLLSDPKYYALLANGAFHRYQECLNWDAVFNIVEKDILAHCRASLS